MCFNRKMKFALNLFTMLALEFILHELKQCNNRLLRCSALQTTCSASMCFGYARLAV